MELADARLATPLHNLRGDLLWMWKCSECYPERCAVSPQQLSFLFFHATLDLSLRKCDFNVPLNMWDLESVIVKTVAYIIIVIYMYMLFKFLAISDRLRFATKMSLRRQTSSRSVLCGISVGVVHAVCLLSGLNVLLLLIRSTAETAAWTEMAF